MPTKKPTKWTGIKPIDLFVDFGLGRRRRRRGYPPVTIQRADVADWANSKSELPIVATENGLLLRSEDDENMGVGFQHTDQRRWWVYINSGSPSELRVSYGATPNETGKIVLRLHAQGSDNRFALFGATPVGQADAYSLGGYTPGAFPRIFSDLNTEGITASATNITPWGLSSESEVDNLLQELENIKADLEKIKDTQHEIITDLQGVNIAG